MHWRTSSIALLLTVVAMAGSSGDPKKPQVLDATHPVEERVTDLLGRMTFEEKVGQLRGAWPGVTAYVKAKDGSGEIAEAWKPLLTDAPIGLLGSTLRAEPFFGVTMEAGLSRREGAEFLNKVQQYVRDHTRLGIPLFVTDDAHRGQQAIGATIFPQLCSMGPTWNPDLQEKVERAIATEMRSQGVTIAFAPNLDVIRDPRWGRNDQNFGEDPWHTSVMGKAAVRGFQGESLNTDHSVVALLRAYPGLGDADGGHDFTGFSRGMRDLHEVVLRPWGEAIRAGAEAVMIEQSEMDGVPVPCSHYYLDDLLRKQWGFKGIALDDNGGIERLVGWRVARDKAHAAALALHAGNDLAVSDANPNRLDRHGKPRAVYSPDVIREALDQGLVSMKEIDRAAARVLRLKFLLGLFENPFVDPDRAESVARCTEHRRLALQAARESMILLKNQGATLPLAKEVQSVAVIGPNADNTWNQLGDYAASHDREDVVTVLDGVKKIAGERGISVRYAEGCGIRTQSKDGFPAALEAARQSDVIVAVVGGSSRIQYPGADGRRGRHPEADTGEGQARATLDLLGVQLDLLKAVKETGKPLVVVLIHGRAHTINWIAENADAIVDAWYPGEAGGTAVAEVLFGEYNPGGKLTVSIPRHVGQLPVYYYHLYAQRKKHLDLDAAGPLYPFGFGLSYTTFQYANLKIEPGSIRENDSAQVTVDVTNSGKVAGDEVVQLYIRDEVASVARPRLQLKGFRRIHLEPGETKPVTFEIGRDELCFYGLDGEWIVEPGDFTLMIGRNSRDMALRGKLMVED
jgi:beta-glucosidase